MVWACSSMVEPAAHNGLVGGSNPSGPTMLRLSGGDMPNHPAKSDDIKQYVAKSSYAVLSLPGFSAVKSRPHRGSTWCVLSLTL